MHFVGAQLGFVFGAQLHKCDWNSEPREAADTEPTQKNKQVQNTTRGRCAHSKKRRGQLPSHETPQASSPPKKEATPTVEPRDAAGVEPTPKQ